VRYFVAVAEELHFGRAAARLQIAQPSLSHQIRLLERRLGVTLFERTSRQVTLTPPGAALLSEGRRLLKQAQRTVTVTRAASVELLTVGFAGSAASGLLPDVLGAFKELHPSVEVSLRELLLDQVDEIRNGEVDVAFTRLLPGQADFQIEVLSREARVVALPSTHRLAARERLSFADLRAESFITNPAVREADPPKRWLDEQIRHALPGRATAKAATIQEILTLVAARRGVCLVPSTVARNYPREDVRYVEVEDADPAVVSIAWTRQTARPIIDAFIETTRVIARAQ